MSKHKAGTTYLGEHCKKCGLQRRSKITHLCVNCTRSIKAQYALKKKKESVMFITQSPNRRELISRMDFRQENYDNPIN